MMLEIVNPNLLVGGIQARGIHVTGHSEHGKGTVCKYLNELKGITYASSSWVACEEYVYHRMKTIGLGYRSIEQCYNDRRNHKELWYEFINEWTSNNDQILGRLIAENYDIYDGIRHKDEFEALKAMGLYHTTIWVDASERVPPQDTNSMTVTREDADIIIHNNGSLNDLYNTCKDLADLIAVEPSEI